MRVGFPEAGEITYLISDNSEFIYFFLSFSLNQRSLPVSLYQLSLSLPLSLRMHALLNVCRTGTASWEWVADLPVAPPVCTLWHHSLPWPQEAHFFFFSSDVWNMNRIRPHSWHALMCSFGEKGMHYTHYRPCGPRALWCHVLCLVSGDLGRHAGAGGVTSLWHANRATASGKWCDGLGLNLLT